MTSTLFLIVCSVVMGSVVGDIVWEQREVPCDINEQASDMQIKRAFLPHCPTDYKVIRAVTSVHNMLLPFGMPIIDSNDEYYSHKDLVTYPELQQLTAVQQRDARRINQQLMGNKISRCVTRTTCYKEDISPEEFLEMKNSNSALKAKVHILSEDMAEMEKLHNEVTGSKYESRVVDGLLLLCIVTLVFSAAFGVASLTQAKFFMDKVSRKISKGVAAFKEEVEVEEISAQKV